MNIVSTAELSDSDVIALIQIYNNNNIKLKFQAYNIEGLKLFWINKAGKTSAKTSSASKSMERR